MSSENEPLVDKNTSFVNNILHREEELVLLSPWEKFTKYKRFPCELITDIILICGIFIMVYFISVQNGYLQNFGEAITNKLLPEGYQHYRDNNFGYSTYYHHDIDEILSDISTTVQNYHTMVETSTDTLGYVPYRNRSNGVRIQITYYNESLRHFLADKLAWNISRKDIDSVFYLSDNTKVWYEWLGKKSSLPKLFNRTESSMRNLFDKMVSIELKMYLHSYFLSKPSYQPDCYEWEIIKYYDFSQRAATPTTLRYKFMNCNGFPNNNTKKISFWLELFILVVSVWSAVVNILMIGERIILWIKKKRQDPHLVVAELKKYLIWWYVISLLSNILNIIGLIVLLSKNNDDIIIMGKIFLGFGGFLCLLSSIRNYYHYPKLYFLVNVIQVGLPGCYHLFVGSFPLFIGYGLAGTVWFGHYALKFEKIIDSLVTLFCVMHGDVIREVFDTSFGINLFYRVLSRIFLYSFIFIFVAIVLNVFLMVLEESYLTNGELCLSQAQKAWSGVEEDSENQVEMDATESTENKNLNLVNEKLQEIIGKIKKAQNKELNREQEKCISLLQFYTAQILKAN